MEEWPGLPFFIFSSSILSSSMELQTVRTVIHHSMACSLPQGFPWLRFFGGFGAQVPPPAQGLRMK